jgi:hypothetical protein
MISGSLYKNHASLAPLLLEQWIFLLSCAMLIQEHGSICLEQVMKLTERKIAHMG